jgi:methionine-rich copper-binding protein CopC
VAGVRRAALLVAASAALIALPALPAWAHNSLVATTPAKGAVVTEQPGTISLETNDELLDVGDGSAIRVQGPDGRYYGDGCTDVVGAMAETRAELGTPGEYTVTWQVVSTDGHPISGTWTFQWQPAEGIELAEGSAEPGACGGDAVVSTPGEQTEEPTDAPPASVPLDALWIGGGVLAAAVAGLATWLVMRRRT